MNFKEMIGLSSTIGEDNLIFLENNPFGIEAIYFSESSIYSWEDTRMIAEIKTTLIRNSLNDRKRKWALPTVEELRAIIDELSVQSVLNNCFKTKAVCIWADAIANNERWANAVALQSFEGHREQIEEWKVFKKYPHYFILVLKNK